MGYLTIHSYAQVVLFPYTWQRDAKRPRNYDELIELSTEITKRIGGNWRHGQGRDIFYPAAGGSDDWAHSQGVDIVYTFELRDRGQYGFLLPEFLIPPAVEEASRGISAVYDHLAPKSAIDKPTSQVNPSVSPESVVEISGPIQKTKCQHNPEKMFLEGRDIPEHLTPAFSCTFKNGKCTVECPAGSKRKLKAVKCHQMRWKPLPLAWKHKEYCVEGLSITKHTNFVDYCFKQGVTKEEEERMKKNCFFVGGGKKILCSVTCPRTGSTVQAVIKMTGKGPNAGSKNAIAPLCRLVKDC